MPFRDLLAVATGRTVGSVHIGQVERAFEGAAAPIFREIRDKLGDEAAAQTLIEDGWSNGYLYLGPVVG